MITTDITSLLTLIVLIEQTPVTMGTADSLRICDSIFEHLKDCNRKTLENELAEQFADMLR